MSRDRIPSRLTSKEENMLVLLVLIAVNFAAWGVVAWEANRSRDKEWAEGAGIRF